MASTASAPEDVSGCSCSVIVDEPAATVNQGATRDQIQRYHLLFQETVVPKALPVGQTESEMVPEVRQQLSI